CFPLSIPLRTSERTGSVIYGMQPADHWKLLLVREPAPVEELRLTASLLLVRGMPALKQDGCFSSCSPGAGESPVPQETARIRPREQALCCAESSLRGVEQAFRPAVQACDLLRL